jgi:hypothetical protein
MSSHQNQNPFDRLFITTGDCEDSDLTADFSRAFLGGKEDTDSSALIDELAEMRKLLALMKNTTLFSIKSRGKPKKQVHDEVSINQANMPPPSRFVRRIKISMK